MSSETPTAVNCVCGFGNDIPKSQMLCPVCGLDLSPLHRIAALREMHTVAVPRRFSRLRFLIPAATFFLGLSVLPVLNRLLTRSIPPLVDYTVVRDEVAEHLSANPGLTEASLYVVSDAKGLHLRGKVPSLIKSQLAASIAKGVSGAAANVSNEVRVEVLSTEVYRVQPGDSFASIAKKVYGSERYWPRIYQVNKEHLTRSGWLHVGQELSIPKEP